jgi:spore coat protein U-like protein
MIYLPVFVLLLGATFGAGATCTFRTKPGGIAFTAFDPSVANTRTASTSAHVNCTASGSPTWQFSGANGSSPLRMKHATQSAFIPYAVAVAFVSGGATNQTWNLTATVLGQDYQNALVGSYTDVLTVTILP